jgi:hypothetical protein
MDRKPMPICGRSTIHVGVRLPAISRRLRLLLHLWGRYVLVVDNLRAYLAGEQVRDLLNGTLDAFTRSNAKAARWITERPRPLLLGMPRLFRQMHFPIGGAGYVLNRAALNWLANVGLKAFLPNATDPREDVFVGSAFWEEGVTTADTRDKAGAFRFTNDGPAQYIYHYDPHPSFPKLMLERYGVEIFKGMQGVSRETIAFHLKGGAGIPLLMRRYHDLLHGSCGNGADLVS